MADARSASFRQAAAHRIETYRPAHPAPHAPPGQQGSGSLTGTWLACEEPGSAEGWLTSGIRLVMDSTLDPGAVIGRHEHPDTEELYVVLAGSLVVTAGEPGAEPQTGSLRAGDVHRIGPGGWHTAAAGPEGARIMVIAAEARR